MVIQHNANFVAAVTSSNLTPGLLISGCIKSIEDHGFVMDIGVKGVKAFMANNMSGEKSSKKLTSCLCIQN